MKQKTRSGLVWLLVLSLMISVSASAIALVSRIRYYTATVDVNSMIPLVPESVTQEELQAAAAARAAVKPVKAAFRPEGGVRASRLRYTAAPQTASVRKLSGTVGIQSQFSAGEPTWFTVSDDKTTWGAKTRVDIFKTSYTNGQGKVTVASGNGEKIIAPGTENSYTFKLKNPATMKMDYTVEVKAYFTPDNIEIPVICRLSRYDGKWVAGGANKWLSVPEFDGTADAAILSEMSYVTYTLDWQWPYTGDNAEDTALANLAVQEDLTLTIEIITTATPVGISEGVNPPASEPPKKPAPEDPVIPVIPIVPAEPDEPEPEKPVVGEELPPKTGDDSNPVLWISIAAISLILLLILIFWKDKEKKDEDPEANESEQSDQTGKK